LTALWFAALFGLGSLAASADALAGLVRHLHLVAILPAAAPPLGLTAHLLLALALAGLGGVFGLAIGFVLYARAGGVLPERPQRAAPVVEPAPTRQRSVKPKSDAVAGSDQTPRVRNRDAHPDAPPRRPLVVSDDVLPYPTTVFEPPVAQAPAPAPVIVPSVADFAVDPFAIEQNHLARDGSAPEPEEPAHDLPPFLAAAWSATQRAEVPVFVAPAEPIIVPAEPIIVPAEPIIVPAEPEWTEPEAIEPETAKLAAAAPSVSLPPLASLAAASPQAPLSEAPLASLGLVQLIERLALAIATRQARLAAAPVLATTIDAVDPRTPLHRFDPLTMDPTGPLLRAKRSRLDQAPMPEDAESDAPETPVAGHGALLHDPLATAGDWHDDDRGDDLLPRFLGGPTADPVADHDDSADDGIIEHRYSSLADMALPRPELMPTGLVSLVAPVVHMPDHDQMGGAGPVVPFPQRLTGGESAVSTPPDLAPNEADRALREALATLRRMSAQR
jgi:hypothetical protein